jgi:ABC-2 type transport system permease protein
MTAYLAIFKLRFALQLQYRAAALASFITNLFFGLIRVMVYQAFYASTLQSQPLTLEQTVTYTWLTQVTFRMQPWNMDTEMLNLVRSGNIAYDLCRPLSLYFSWYFRLLALRLVPALLTGVPILIIVLLLPGHFRAALPASAAAGIAWIAATLMALLLGCAFSNLITISALWTLAGDGMQRILPALMMIFSGSIVPLAFFPDALQTVLRILPFSGLMDTPFRLYTGAVPADRIPGLLGLQLLWTCVLILVGIKLLEAGTKHLVVQGG